MRSTKTGPLEGVRIADFTWAAAGPQGTLLVGFLGAEVIKVESIRRLDLTRRGWNKVYETLDGNPAFSDLNLNKLGIRLDMSQAGACDLALQLVAVSDAVVDNFRPGVMDRLGLGYAALRRINPTIIMVSSSNCGATGPESGYPGYAGIFNAMGGLAHITGYEEGPPTPLRDTIDLRVGTALAYAITAALYHRRRTGQGQFIDMSAREVISCLVGDQLLDYTMNGRNPGRHGNRDALMAPHNTYRCKGNDAWVSIAVGNEQEWRALCRAVGHSEWQADLRFADVYARKQNEVDLDKLITGWTKERTPQEATAVLQRAGVAAMPSMSAKDLVEDEHLCARGAYVTVEHPELGRQTVVGVPWKLSRTPATIRRPGPLFGEHNQDVFGNLLGLPPGEVERLTKAGVLH
ncbi:MAG: CoA transferase [Chloroflexi bacterium]|nr:CoA transferase [Chloroflexota bacterium]